MHFINFVSTGDPVTVEAAGDTFTVSEGNPHRISLRKIELKQHGRLGSSSRHRHVPIGTRRLSALELRRRR